jgi:hypothetical protein
MVVVLEKQMELQTEVMVVMEVKVLEEVVVVEAQPQATEEEVVMVETDMYF